MKNITVFSKLKKLIFYLTRITRVLPSSLRRSIINVFILMTIGGFIELLSIIALTFFFRLLYSPEFIFEIPVAQRIITHFSSFDNLFSDTRQIMIWGCFLPVSMIILKNIFMAKIAWKSSFLSQRVAAYIGKTIMKKYLAMPYSWHLSAQQALAILAMQRRFSLGGLLLNLLTAFSNIITVAMLFCGLFFYAPMITLGTVFFMALISISTFTLLKRRIDNAAIISADESKEEGIATQTALSGVREIIIYQKMDTFLNEINSHVEAGISPRTFLAISPTVPTWTLESGGFFLIWVTIYIMVNYTSSSHAVICETIALLALTAWRVLPSLNRVVGATVSIKAIQATALPCLDYLESLKSARQEEYIEADKDFFIKNEISFDHLSYNYPSSTLPVLRDICCTIPLGATIGLVGRSGSGKTTFINVLCGLLTPTSGNILVDGKIMKQSQLIAYRSRIGYVPQNPYILSGTVAQNVAFKDWGEIIDRNKVQSACQNAAIDFLGENCLMIDRPAGKSLSGGQMQRVSIARALYTDPDIVIFDEATSALDQCAEAKIQKIILKNKGKRTSIIAAHRLETLEICDIIFWLENGKLIKSGSAKEILHDYKEAIAKTFNI